MALFETLFSTTSDDTVQQPQAAQHEIYPEEKYTVAYAVTVRHEELTALDALLEADQTTPTVIEASPLLEDAIEDIGTTETPTPRLRTSSERLVDDLRELHTVWDTQVEDSIGTVWWPIGTDSTFQLYLPYLEARADAEEDAFTFPARVGHVQTLVQRGLDAMASEDNSKLAVVHKRDVPWAEPTDDT
jgi:hypothetical protein